MKQLKLKKKLLAPSRSPDTGQAAAPPDEVPSQQVSALGSLCSAYASESEDNEEMPGKTFRSRSQSTTIYKSVYNIF